MSRPKVISVFGTRPEAIKMAPLALLLNADPALEHRIAVTAQHRGLLDDVLELFGLTPDHDLDLMRERQSLEHITSGALTGLSELFAAQRPDFVLVHGDTTTTLAASLAAFYARIPLGHVEAGLRTSTLALPFPEEANRRIADLLAAQYYCPTQAAGERLRSNPECGGEVFVSGNTALDAVRLAQALRRIPRDARLAAFTEHSGPRLLLTAHRRENWGAPLHSICTALLDVLERLPDARLCYCMHPNPAVREVAAPLLGEHPRAILAEPPRYDEFITLLDSADLILTDSGGIQEEVTQLRRYCLILRDETERPEALDAGFGELIGASGARIGEAVARALPACLAARGRGGGSELLPPPEARSPFGDGYSAQRIQAALHFALGLRAQRPADYA